MPLAAAIWPTIKAINQPKPNADHAAEQAEQGGFGQELDQDIASARAQGFAQADLAGAFGDRDQHDVHDADAAHQQRNAGDAAQEDGQHAGDGLGGGDKILLGEDGEIIRAEVGAVAGAQDLRNLFAWPGAPYQR